CRAPPAFPVSLIPDLISGVLGTEPCASGRRGTLIGVKCRSHRTVCVLQAVRKHAHRTHTGLIRSSSRSRGPHLVGTLELLEAGANPVARVEAGLTAQGIPP